MKYIYKLLLLVLSTNAFAVRQSANQVAPTTNCKQFTISAVGTATEPNLLGVEAEAIYVTQRDTTRLSGSSGPAYDSVSCVSNDSQVECVVPSGYEISASEPVTVKYCRQALVGSIFESYAKRDEANTYTAPQTFTGGFSLDPANMSGADASRLGLKEYGIADTSVTLSTPGTIDFFTMIPYKLTNGKWRMRINGTGSTNSVVSSVNVIIANVTFANFASLEVGEGHAVTVYGFEGGVADKSFIAIARKNGNFIRLSTSSGGGLNRWSIAGDIPLESKPIWVD